MKLYIQIENGAPINHPAFEENLLGAFSEIPSNWEPFVRVEKPEVYLKKVASDEPEYKKVDGVWTDVWTLVNFSLEEKAAAESYRKARWENLPNAFNFTAWVFNEATGEFEPPIPRPTNTNVNYRWCGVDNNWKEAPTKPDDGKTYKFDFVAWQWVEVTL
jgi:hypothetical protein